MYKLNLNILFISTVFFGLLAGCTTSDMALFTETALVNTLDSDARNKNKNINNRRSLNSGDAIHAVTGGLLVVSAEKYKQYQESEKLKFREIANVDTSNNAAVTSQKLESEQGPPIVQELVNFNNIDDLNIKTTEEL